MDTKTILRTIRERKTDQDFFPSLLEQLEDEIAKCERQIQLTEDAVLIYHIQRAPTRRVWFVNVGTCRGDRAKWIVNDFRDEYLKTRGDSSDPVRQEDIYLPMFKDGDNSSTIENQDSPTTWDGGALLETFYAKRARLLNLYARLYEAVEKNTITEIVSIICESGSLAWRLK